MLFTMIEGHGLFLWVTSVHDGGSAFSYARSKVVTGMSYGFMKNARLLLLYNCSALDLCNRDAAVLPGMSTVHDDS